MTARGHTRNYTTLTDATTETVVGDLAHLLNQVCGGWVVWMTDHTLYPTIHARLEALGRYVFAPLPYFHPGRSVRLSGDGPSSWTDWIVCSRTSAQHRWGTLPGGYVAGEGWNDKARMGGKPTKLMELLVSDYSRPGELVCDPYMGAGTTGVACIKTGRRFVGIEIDPDAFDLACRRVEEAHNQPDMLIELSAQPEPVQTEILVQDDQPVRNAYQAAKDG